MSVAAMVLGAPAALAQEVPPPEPYRDPPFTCEVIDYGTEAPTLPPPEADPLCVRYDKTNITVSTLEVVDFLAAEPGRVAIVAGRCAYWQRDHWTVRVAPDTTPLVEWEGSYWYDARTGTAAGILRGLRVGGQPADGAAFADALRPLVGDENADQLAAFSAEGGGGGATFALPDGFAYPDCAGPGGDQPPADDQPPGDESIPAPSAATVSAGSGVGSSLPRTGSSPPLPAALAAAMAAAAAGVLVRRAARSR